MHGTKKIPYGCDNTTYKRNRQLSNNKHPFFVMSENLGEISTRQMILGGKKLREQMAFYNLIEEVI